MLGGRLVRGVPSWYVCCKLLVRQRVLITPRMLHVPLRCLYLPYEQTFTQPGRWEQDHLPSKYMLVLVVLRALRP